MHRETSTTTNTSLQIIRETIELLSTVKLKLRKLISESKLHKDYYDSKDICTWGKMDVPLKFLLKNGFSCTLTSLPDYAKATKEKQPFLPVDN
jgi:hypothetical protein